MATRTARAGAVHQRRYSYRTVEVPSDGKLLLAMLNITYLLLVLSRVFTGCEYFQFLSLGNNILSAHQDSACLCSKIFHE